MTSKSPKEEKRKEREDASNHEDLNDTGDGMPLTLGGGGYGGSGKTATGTPVADGRDDRQS